MISIVILSYRNPPLLRLCLRSLAIALPRECECEIIVVDGASTIETRSVVTEESQKAFQNIRLIAMRENTGYTRGVNEGIRAARGQFILAINYDIVMAPGAIQAMVGYVGSHPDVGLIGPRLLNFDDTPQPSSFRFYRPWTIASRRIPWLPGAAQEHDRFTLATEDLASVRRVDWVSGAAFMTTRRALDVVGALDERFFHYFSDVDWAWRFWENGYAVVFYPMAAMYHYSGRTSKGRFGVLDPLFNQATRWHIADAIRYFFAHGIRGRRPAADTDRQPHLLTA